MLRVRLAGGLALDADGREIAPPRSRRARAVLAYLAAHPGAHARGELAARFWPDVLDESARTSLRAALTELRGALGDESDRLVATRAAVALDAWVDVRELAALLAAGRAAEALAAGDGALLPGIEDDWAHELRRAHDERRAQAHDQLATQAEAVGDLAAAIRHARAAVALDPLAEAAGRRLAALSAEGGSRAAATVVPPAALARADDGVFVGRAGELERLAAAWDGVRARRTRRLVLLAGEPGVGKTRLAMRFARAAADEGGATVLLGRSSEEALAAFEPFTEVLRHVGTEAARALAGPAAGELDRLLGDAGDASGQDAGARHRLFTAVDDVLTGLAERRPLVLVLDDLHWADRPTLLLLGFVLRSSRPAPLLAIGTYRDTEVGRRTPLAGALAELRRDGGAERVALRGLAAGEVGELAVAWLGAEAAAGVAAAVHERTEGNAFYVEEVLRGLAEHDLAVPESVRHAVGARLARLGPAADELLAVAAALGQRVDAGLLQSVAQRPAEEVEAALDELLDAHLLRVGDERGLAFSHALVREAVVAELNPLRRARLHRRAAEALEAQGDDRHLEEIAHHLSEAADPRAAGALHRAGEHALAMLAYEEAAEFYARALDALDGSDGAARAPLLLARGDALLGAGEPGAARACFTDAAAVARATGDRSLLARAALGHAGLGVAIIDLDEPAIALLEEALDALGKSEPLLRSELLARLAVERYYAPSRDRSEALSAQAVAVARSAGDQRAVAAALNARHVALWRPDCLGERLEAAEEMIAVAVAAGERQLELQARNWRVVDLFEAAEMAEWRAEVRRHGELAAELRLPGFTWYTPLWDAVTAVHAGRYGEGAALRERAREAGRRAGDRNADLFAEMLRFCEVSMSGDWDAFDAALVEDKIATSPAGMAWRCSYAWMLAATGRTDEAREHLAVVFADGFAALPFDANWPSAMGECAEAIAILADPALAEPVYERLLPYADRTLTAGRAPATARPSACSPASPRRWGAPARPSSATSRASAATRRSASRCGPSTDVARSPPCARRRRARVDGSEPGAAYAHGRWRSSWPRCSFFPPRSPGSSTRCASTPCAAPRGPCPRCASGRSTAAWH
jgi:DNA-binding SARP family transcriptional activator